MKLSHQLDFAPLQQQAYASIDAYYSKAAAQTSPVHLLHQSKAKLASAVLSGTGDSSALQAEATRRGMTISALAALILQKNSDQQNQLLSLESARSDARAQVAAATTGQQLTAIINSHQ